MKSIPLSYLKIYPRSFIALKPNKFSPYLPDSSISFLHILLYSTRPLLLSVSHTHTPVPLTLPSSLTPVGIVPPSPHDKVHQGVLRQSCSKRRPLCSRYTEGYEREERRQYQKRVNLKSYRSPETEKELVPKDSKAGEHERKTGLGKKTL